MGTSGAILFISLLIGTTCNDVRYVPKITDSIFGCDHFDNKVVDCSGMVLGSAKGEEGDAAAKLGGTIVTDAEIISDYDIEIDIWKMMEMGKEFMYSTRTNFCASLDKTDAPWYPVVHSMNISSCPIPISSFEIAEMTISLDCVKDVMCHDFVGEYRIAFSIVDKTKKISCHIFEISIVEEEIED